MAKKNLLLRGKELEQDQVLSWSWFYGGTLLLIPGYLISAAHQNLGTSLWIKLNLNKLELVLFTFSDPVLGHIVYNLAEPPSICANMYNA